MPAIANFTVWVEVDEQRLPECGVDFSADGTEVSCWIPSEAGKNFAIFYSDSIREHATSTNVYIDGIRALGKLLYPRSWKKKTNSVVTMRGISTSDTSYRPLVFSNFELVEDEDFETKTAPNIGSIQCTIHHVQIHSGYASKRKVHELPSLQVNERAKKGMVHGIQLGNNVARMPKKCRCTTELEGIVTFKFKYRPIAVLMADGIAPSYDAPRSRNLRKSLSDIIDLTIDDDHGMAESRRKHRSEKVKREPGSVRQEVKNERSTSPVTDIIDLTR